MMGLSDVLLSNLGKIDDENENVTDVKEMDHIPTVDFENFLENL
jgi:hypothetical protein